MAMTNAHEQRRKTARRALSAGLIMACLAVLSAAPSARATIQEESCIYPDVEYPMPCDDED